MRGAVGGARLCVGRGGGPARRLIGMAGLAVVSAVLAPPRTAPAPTAVTLDEVTVQTAAPPVRSTPAPAAPARSVTPAPVVQTQPVPALSVVSTTPVTGLGFDRDKVPALVQTLSTDDFTRANSPSVL